MSGVNYLTLRSTVSYSAGGVLAQGSSIMTTDASGLRVFTNDIRMNTATYSTLLGSTVTVSSIVAPAIVGTVTLGQNMTYPNRFVELGTDAANSTYLDFHSNDSALPDYSTRIQSFGGATTGAGVMNLYGSTIGIMAPAGVGIGKSNPAYALDVAGTVNISGSYYVNGAPMSSSQWTTSGSIIYYSSGNVGIGIATPISPMQIYQVLTLPAISTSVAFPSQLAVTTNSISLKLGAYYTSGTGEYCAIQASNFYSSAEHPDPLVLNPIGGYVGIGKTNPAYALDVAGTVNITGSYYVNGAPMSSSQWTTSGSNIYYTTGSVGIGTNNPSQPLHVYTTTANAGLTFANAYNSSTGTISLYTTTAAGNFIVGGTAHAGLVLPTDGKDLFLGRKTDLSCAVVVQGGTGNVGIGMVNPNAALALNLGSTNNVALALNSSGAGWGSGMKFINTTASTGREYGFYAGSEGNFHIADTTVGSDRILITSTGNIGIGTFTPAGALDVVGSIIASNASGGLCIKNAAGAVKSIIAMDSGNTVRIYGGSTSTALHINPDNSANSVYINYNSPATFAVYGGLTPAITSTATGAVGIGTASGVGTTLSVYPSLALVGQQFAVGGNINTFYPVLIDAGPSWGTTNTYKISVSRSNVHLDGNWKGAMTFVLEGHSTLWGNGADYSRYKFVGSNSGPVSWLTFIANYIEDGTSAFIVLMLRGATTYYFSGEGCILNNGNPSGTSLTVPSGNNAVYASTTTISVPFDGSYASGDNRDNLYSKNGYIGVGTNNPTSLLHVNGSINCSGLLVNGTAVATGTGSVWSVSGSNITYTSGNVGIGTASPSNLLHLHSGFAGTGMNLASGLLFTASNGSNTWQTGSIVPYIAANATGTYTTDGYPGGLAFSTKTPDNQYTTAVSVKMVLNANGYLGIGITNPVNLLDVQGAARSGTHANGRPVYITGDIADASAGFEFRHSNGTQGIGIGYNSLYAAGSQTNQNLNLFPKGTGNVGIGLLAPTNLIHAYRSSDAGVGQYIQNPSAGTSAYSFIWLLNDSGNGGGIYLNSSARTSDGGTNTMTIRNDQGAVHIQGAGGFNNANGITVLGSGNVGIGTNSPTATLFISSSADYGNSLVVNTAWPSIRLGQSSSTGRDWCILNGAAGAGVGQGNFGIFDITSSAYRFCINSSGYVGIGTNTPGSLLHIGGSGAISSAIMVSNASAADVATKTLLSSYSNASVMPSASGSSIYLYCSSGTTVYRYILAASTYFTGQHANQPIDPILKKNIQDYIGLIVSSADEGYYSINPVTKQITTGIDAITITEALPYIKLTDTDKDPAVWGVLTNVKNDNINTDGTIPLDNNEDWGDRLGSMVRVNGLGEGAVWVTNINGSIRNGDLICSSVITGYGRKQDDDLFHSYTVAKATMSCAFDTTSTKYRTKTIEHNGNTYIAAFVGCSYHCS